ncbi:hypothetical protein M153_16250002500 [Pseudoloma neurophilia]|uniref:Uncharacterized protein n=1 Tax=Pseudoloma neurophilia TaxID=146866 RepID=A0A0R0LUH4_9MICR|nr:hypothetical protein M153_16250002500 [Pseudoloma neurophilia]
MNQENDEFFEIERKRRQNVQKQMDALVQRRKILNQKVLYELEELKRQNESIESFLFTPYFPSREIEQQNLSFPEQVPKNDQFLSNDQIEQNFTIQNEVQKPEQHMTESENEPQNLSFTETPSLEIDSSLLEDQSNPNLQYQKSGMNINLSDFFLQNYVFTQQYIITEKNLQNEKSKMSSSAQFKLKLLVNKRIGQITTDLQHLAQIINICKENYNLVFIELLIIKILQQAKVQISNNFEIYKSYGLLLSELYSNDLHSLLLMSLIYNQDKEKNLKSIYTPYFELLRIRNMFSESFNFIASVLNERPNFDVFFILESYLLILGPNMLRYYGGRFKGVLKYIVNIYIRMGDNEPSIVRIKTIIDKLVNSYM